MIDKLNIGQKFIITYRPNTHNGVARPKLKNGKDTRQITRRAQWTDKSRVVKDQEGKIRYITYYRTKSRCDCFLLRYVKHRFYLRKYK